MSRPPAKSVQEHEAKQRALFESSEHMFWTVDKRIAVTSFNRGYARHDRAPAMAYDRRSTATTDAPRKRFASDDYHAFWEQKYAEAFSGQSPAFRNGPASTPRATRVCNEIFLSPVFEADGSVEEVFGIGHEITEQKEAEDLVREQAARLKAIFENSANMMIWTLDHDFRITSMNEHFKFSNERAMGLSFKIGDDFIRALMDRVADKRFQPIVDKFAAALKGRPQQFEVELKNHSGRSLWVENFLNPITVDGEVVEISCLAFGITDKKESPAQTAGQPAREGGAAEGGAPPGEEQPADHQQHLQPAEAATWTTIHGRWNCCATARTASAACPSSTRASTRPRTSAMSTWPPTSTASPAT